MSTGLKLIVLINVAIGLCNKSFAEEKWNLNDVSFLFKIPSLETETNDSLLEPRSRGVKGELLPRSAYKNLPTLLNAGSGNPTLFSGAMRVIGARFDPCPGITASNCKPEMRLVWQPVQWDTFKNKWMVRDGAVHTFYQLKAQDFHKVKQLLWQLKLKYEKKGIFTMKTPLSIHPALENKETSNEFSRDLQSILLAYCGEQNLYKMTFTSLLVPTRWWRFGSFVLQEEKWVEEEIPRLAGAVIEDLFNVGREEGSHDVPGQAMDAIFNILPGSYPQEDDLTPLINKGYRFNDERDFDVFKEKLAATDRFRNPVKTNSQNLDCASCHYADASVYYAGLRFPELSTFRSADAYTNPDPDPDPELYNLNNTTLAKSATRIVRAFGYFKQQPIVNQRVIHESAEVAKWLNSK